MPNVDRFTPVVQAVYDLLTNSKVALGLQDVWYGDQNLIPRYPAVAVEAGPFTRQLAGIGGKGRTDNQIRVLLLVYSAKIADVQTTRKATDILSETIMDKLHEDITMGNTVIHGFVTAIEPGYATRGGTLMRTTRITWEGFTKTGIA